MPTSKCYYTLALQLQPVSLPYRNPVSEEWTLDNIMVFLPTTKNFSPAIELDKCDRGNSESNKPLCNVFNMGSLYRRSVVRFKNAAVCDTILHVAPVFPS